MKTTERARGKWRGILLSLGVDSAYLTGKHSACPFCEGKNRFRWDNADGKGTFICNQCGAGDGMEFLQRLKGWDFRTAANQIDEIVGGVVQEKPKPKFDPEKRAAMLNQLWKSAHPLNGYDGASCYLSGRSVMPTPIPNCLRFAPECPVPNGGGSLPAMIALVLGLEGKPVNIHRTFLGPSGKADMENPRALMPGELPEGSAVRLFKLEGDHLGIAEGIETAIAAAGRFKIPVWAALNSTMLAKWQPPEGITRVTIMGDNDKAFGGQMAAFSLAHRLSVRLKIAVDVQIPNEAGKDWADLV